MPFEIFLYDAYLGQRIRAKTDKTGSIYTHIASEDFRTLGAAKGSISTHDVGRVNAYQGCHIWFILIELDVYLELRQIPAESSPRIQVFPLQCIAFQT